MTGPKRAQKAAPAFQFYPGDWMSGSPGRMTPEETHVYIWLLCLDWTQDGFLYDAKELAHWCRLTKPRFAKAWVKVSANFVERSGRLHNPRLEKERRKQVEFNDRLSEAGRNGAAKRWKKERASDSEANSHPNDQPNSHPNGVAYGKTMRLQTSVKEDSLESSEFVQGGKAGAAEGARAGDYDTAILDDLNRRKRARGEEPVDAL